MPQTLHYRVTLNVCRLPSLELCYSGVRKYCGVWNAKQCSVSCHSKLNTAFLPKIEAGLEKWSSGLIELKSTHTC